VRFDLIGKAFQAWPHIEALLVLWRQAGPHVAAILEIFTPVTNAVEETKMVSNVSGQEAFKQVVGGGWSREEEEAANRRMD
jgi:hypothetical protein